MTRMRCHSTKHHLAACSIRSQVIATQARPLQFDFLPQWIPPRQDQTVPSLGLINTSSDTCDTCDTCFMLIAPENTFNTNLQTCYGKALKNNNNNNNSNDYRENCVCGYEISSVSIDKRPAVFNKMAATDVRTTHGLLVIF